MENLISVAFVGEASVGKTSIITKFLKQKNMGGPTIAVDAYTITVDGETFQVFDTAGQEAFHSTFTSTIHNTSIVVIVFDLTNGESFDQIEKYWLDFIYNIKMPSYIFIVGNKSDLAEKRKVNFDRANDLAKSVKSEHQPLEGDESFYFETCALDGTNVDTLFEVIATKTKQIKENKVIDSIVIKPTDEDDTKDKKDKNSCQC